MADIVSAQDVVDVLKQVKYPGFDRDIVSFGLVKVKDIQAADGNVVFNLAFSTQDESTRRQITLAAREAVEQLPGVNDIQIMGPPPGQPHHERKARHRQRRAFTNAMAADLGKNNFGWIGQPRRLGFQGFGGKKPCRYT